MTENSEFKVPLIKKPFNIKKVIKLNESENLLNEKDLIDEIAKKPPLKDDDAGNNNLKEKSETKPETVSDQQKSLKELLNLSPTPAPQVQFPYKEPEWSGYDNNSSLYSLDVIKQGVSIGAISLKGKAYFVVGRLPSCDIQLEHPSISRHHAVIQYQKGNGWFLYDLNSTHGSCLNKRKLHSHKYTRLHVGHVMKFGGSSRLLVLAGPDSDKEVEGDIKKFKKVEKNDDTECSWGMLEEEEEEDDGVNPFAEIEDDSIYKDDPKKALKQVYQREGVEGPKFEFEGVGLNRVCRLELPMEGINGGALVAEARVAGNKRDAEVACALEACHLLDQNGLLREARHESVYKKRKRALKENDFYDEDDDEYLDRTGDIEKKRKERMNRMNLTASKVLSHEMLMKEVEGVLEEMDELQKKLDKDAELQKKLQEEDEETDDALELFMKGLKAGGLGAREKMDLKRRLLELKHSKVRLEKLIEASKPAQIHLIPPPCKADERSRRRVNMVDDVGPLVKDKVYDKAANGKKIEDEAAEESAQAGDNQQAPECSVSKDDSGKIEDSRGGKIFCDPFEDVKEAAEISSSTLHVKHKKGEFVKPKAVLNAKLKTKESNKAKKKNALLLEEDDQAEAEVYSAWLPPSNQSGDGKTDLNKHFGY